MRLEFTKMSGAGNDFIMVDNRSGRFSSHITRENIGKLCRRGLAVGADGLIEIRNHPTMPFAMKYYNSDGGEAEMCGNGARCICRFAVELGIVQFGSVFGFASDAGIHNGLVTADDEARIWMTEPVIHPEQHAEKHKVAFLDTGVPHAVVFVNDTRDGSFEEEAPLLRRHPVFGKQGANVDWVKVLDTDSLEMRTYERGVEGETLACGTGAVAAAVAATGRFDSVHLPVNIHVKSGRTLVVGKDSMGWWLQGEAVIVYTAETYQGQERA